MKTSTISVAGQGGSELFVAHDFGAGMGLPAWIRSPGNAKRLRLVPEDERSAFTGVTHGWPRTRLWRRYFAGRDPMLDREPRGKPGDYLKNVGPMESRIRCYQEREWATLPPVRYGAREPIADSLGHDGKYNPIVDAPGGRWISPYQGVGPAEMWWWHHVRTLDRSTGAWSDPPLAAMLDANGLTPTCRFDVQARGNPALSMLPSGKKSSVPFAWWGDMKVWMSSCGNAGYNGAHLIRQYRAALAMAELFPDPTFQRIASEDIGAIARDVTYTLSPYKARPGWDGDTTGPDFHQGAYMNWTPLAYRAKAPVGADGGRTMGWYAHVLAAAMHLGHVAEMKPTAVAFLDWTKASLLPSGFIQQVRFDATGGPQPKDCGVQAHELSAAEIEAPIFAASITCLALQTYGVIPQWCVDMLDKLAGIYLRFWPVGHPPAWSKYWIHGEIDGKRYTAAQVRMAPAGPRSTTNAWWLFEAAYRFGSPETRKAIYQRKAEILNLWDAREDIRPWAAGLVGALDLPV